MSVVALLKHEFRAEASFDEVLARHPRFPRLAVAGFMAVPVTEVSVFAFSAVTGLTWLATVPLTANVAALDLTGSYDLAWMLSGLLALVAVFLHLPIDDRPVAAGACFAGP
ncbi:MAG: hypothetical protein WCO00_11540 [Rhodospirillaceae bacterium]